MDDALYTAIWRGPFTGQLRTGETVEPGQQAEVTTEDLKSAHWQLVDESAQPQPQPAPVPAPEPSPEPDAVPPAPEEPAS